ncbi:MAG TPA: hypothetical protein PLB62_02520 [Candidatus Sumerlaeota bacterium]|nr:hypothetical protein [Candidatus Sumerlaeota bacterium]
MKKKSSIGQVFFLYGNEEDQLVQERLRILDQCLPSDQREENLVEFYPQGNQKTLNLGKIIGDLLSELGTVSFFLDSRRVVILYNLQELYIRRGRDTSAGEEEDSEDNESDKAAPASPKGQKNPQNISSESMLIRYIEEQLPETPNVLIIVNVEDYEKNQRVDLNAPLVKALSRVGQVKKFASGALIFTMEDSIRERDLRKALDALEKWFKRDPESARRNVFYSILKQLTLLLQAKVMESRRFGAEIKEEDREMIFPSSLKYNLLKERDFNQRKVIRGAKMYSTSELIRGMENLLHLNQYIYPMTTDQFVPDIKIMYEKFLLELLVSI